MTPDIVVAYSAKVMVPWSGYRTDRRPDSTNYHHSHVPGSYYRTIAHNVIRDPPTVALIPLVYGVVLYN